MKTFRTLHIIVSGRVQGVGYRWFARNAAVKLRLTGTVENLMNGDVELFVSGTDDSLDAYLLQLKEGPSFGLVRNLDIHDVEPVRTYSDFSIKLDRSW